MAWTNWGFDGTINEAQWSQMAGLLGNGYVAAANGDCAVTAVPGARSVSVAAGTLYGDGVVSVNSGAETVAMTTPVNGQWYLICLKREWSTNTASLRAVAGATTTTTTPTTAPTSFPTINTSPGVLTDQPIAWAWCNSANTTVVIFDLRLLPMRTQPVSVADAAKRDAKFPTPAQGNQVWRDDLGTVETYFGLYNASTNPGGRDTAGWHTNGRPNGLIPVRVPTVTIATGTGSSNALGEISFSNATSVSLDGFITSAYKDYKIIVNITCSTASSCLAKWISSGTVISNGYYGASVYVAYNSGAPSLDNQKNNAANAFMGYVSTANSMSEITINQNGGFAKYVYQSFDVGFAAHNTGGYHANTVATGFQILPQSGNFGGTISVYGFNK